MTVVYAVFATATAPAISATTMAVSMAAASVRLVRSG
jgi:hypothetical protein